MNINNKRCRPLSTIKLALVKAGRKPRHVRWGLYSGLTLHLDLASETQIYLGLWEQETYRFIRSALSSCRWFIDVGAGKGELSILLATQPNVAKVIACEPVASEVEILRMNLKLNASILKAPIEIVPNCVGTESLANAIPLEHLGVDYTFPGLIKIDVDGAEMDVLRSGLGFLKGGAATLLVETHSKALERECIAFLEEHDYQCRIIPNSWWRLIVPEQRAIEHNRWLWAQPHSALLLDRVR
jgi:hypothetical protein